MQPNKHILTQASNHELSERLEQQNVTFELGERALQLLGVRQDDVVSGQDVPRRLYSRYEVVQVLC